MIDLHCHSVYSDGTDTPEELIAAAELGGLSALALTDHDTVDGLERFLAAGAKSSVEPIPGVELSAEFGTVTLHLLGYLFNPQNTALRQTLEWVREGREVRNSRMLEKLNALGYSLTPQQIRKHAATDLIGRPHFASALLEQGHFSDAKKIYNQLLGKGKAAYVDRRRLTPEQCIEAIRTAGGVAVLAHPMQTRLSMSKLRRLIRRLRDAGLGGLEVWHPSHRPHEINALLRACDEFDLTATGGSDFHGANTPNLQLGRGFGTLCDPDNVPGKLLRRASDGS
jgi:3',5'-nucleoside bisphosphate phosphatase